MTPRRVAVIGAGVAGLAAAHRLTAEGVACDVYERWPGLGGQAATLDTGGGVLLERYYHHLFETDRHMRSLCDELGLAIDFLPSSVAVFSGGRSHPFTTPLDLLRFEPLPLSARLRMGAAVLRVRRSSELAPFERVTACEWITRHMGAPSWEVVWGPLLRGKFGDRAEEFSMAWIWSKLRIRRGGSRTEVLGYPRGGFEPLFGALRERIEGGGGRVLIDRPAVSVARDGDGTLAVTPGAPDSFRRGHDPRAFEAAGEAERYDAVVATVPNDVFASLLDPALAAELAPGYLDRLEAIEYHATVCLVLELDRRFSPYYWTNVADPRLPFVGLIEQTNLVPPDEYAGRRFLYVANYVERSDPLYSMGLDEVLEAYDAGLRLANPDWDRAWIRNAWLFREPDAQPVVTVGYDRLVPPLETGAAGLLLANTTQVYPEDRGTNYAVRLGEEAAGAVAARLAS